MERVARAKRAQDGFREGARSVGARRERSREAEELACRGPVLRVEARAVENGRSLARRGFLVCGSKLECCARERRGGPRGRGQRITLERQQRVRATAASQLLTQQTNRLSGVVRHFQLGAGARAARTA